MNDVPAALPDVPTAPHQEGDVYGNLTNTCQMGHALEVHWRVARNPVKIEIGDCFQCRVHVLVVYCDDLVVSKGEILDYRSETAAYVVATMQNDLRQKSNVDFRCGLALNLLASSVASVAEFFVEDSRIASEVSAS
jgi:hypothetical protein